ncbi:hypothetical protein [Methylophilus aquaticus]|uniref:Uncharacterized protein n=1 Tax=Methylophilus aquaticus TaxID=1971610 RepID=A0ABT9JP75_9PROT|nr:hypothetical protein [Methylophilus aquaticus]MDP8566389.1 hypothetical protein [Methylophilus aquaticus]
MLFLLLILVLVFLLNSLILFLSSRILALDNVTFGRSMAAQVAVFISIIVYAVCIVLLGIDEENPLHAIVMLPLVSLIYAWILGVSVVQGFLLNVITAVIAAVLYFSLIYMVGVDNLVPDNLSAMVPELVDHTEAEPENGQELLSGQSVISD